MKHHLAKSLVEKFIQPAGITQSYGHTPVNDGIALVVFAWQSWQIEAPICFVAGESAWFFIRLLGFHLGRIEPTHVGCYDFSGASGVSLITIY
jgi:hypothetical protein